MTPLSPLALLPLVGAFLVANPGNALEQVGTAFLWLMSLVVSLEVVGV